MLPPPSWRQEFVQTGFDETKVFFKQCPLRAGRWSNEEIAYTLRMIHDLASGQVRTTYRCYVRDILQKELHTSSMRIFKKLKGHKVLKSQTLVFGHVDRNILAEAKRNAQELQFPTLEALHNRALKTTSQALRKDFLERIAIDVFAESRRRSL